MFSISVEGYGKKPRRKFAKKVPWTGEELSAVKEYFKAHIASKSLPNKAMVAAAQEKYKILKNRKWLTIRAKVRYIYMKM